jgi:hypothetical protein
MIRKLNIYIFISYFKSNTMDIPEFKEDVLSVTYSFNFPDFAFSIRGNPVKTNPTFK